MVAQSVKEPSASELIMSPLSLTVPSSGWGYQKEGSLWNPLTIKLRRMIILSKLSIITIEHFLNYV